MICCKDAKNNHKMTKIVKMGKKWKKIKKCKTKPYFSLICQLENWTSEQYPLQIATESYPVKKTKKKARARGRKMG